MAHHQRTCLRHARCPLAALFQPLAVDAPYRLGDDGSLAREVARDAERTLPRQREVGLADGLQGFCAPGAPEVGEVAGEDAHAAPRRLQFLLGGQMRLRASKGEATALLLLAAPALDGEGDTAEGKDSNRPGDAEGSNPRAPVAVRLDQAFQRRRLGTGLGAEVALLDIAEE